MASHGVLSSLDCLSRKVSVLIPAIRGIGQIVHADGTDA